MADAGNFEVGATLVSLNTATEILVTVQDAIQETIEW